jgi:hypothetical protein
MSKVRPKAAALGATAQVCNTRLFAGSPRIDGRTGMLFLFPGRIELDQLRTPLELFVRELEAAQLEAISEMQISLLGWRPEARCQIRNKQGDISQIVFSRVHDENGVPLNEWVRRPGGTIDARPDDLEFNPLAIMMGHDD